MLRITHQGRFYDAFAQHSRGKIITSLFTERDDAIHAAIKKPVALAYSMNALLDYEKLVDNVIETMVEKLKSEFTSKTTVPICDMGSWLQYCKQLESL
jgi:hypothetical protein